MLKSHLLDQTTLPLLLRPSSARYKEHSKGYNYAGLTVEQCQLWRRCCLNRTFTLSTCHCACLSRPLSFMLTQPDRGTQTCTRSNMNISRSTASGGRPKSDVSVVISRSSSFTGSPAAIPRSSNHAVRYSTVSHKEASCTRSFVHRMVV